MINSFYENKCIAATRAVSDTGMHPIHYALSEKQFAVAKHIITWDGTGILKKDSDDRTVFHYAVKFGAEEILKLIVKFGTHQINAADAYGQTPLEMAREVESEQNENSDEKGVEVTKRIKTILKNNGALEREAISDKKNMKPFVTFGDTFAFIGGATGLVSFSFQVSGEYAAANTCLRAVSTLPLVAAVTNPAVGIPVAVVAAASSSAYVANKVYDARKAEGKSCNLI